VRAAFFSPDTYRCASDERFKQAFAASLNFIGERALKNLELRLVSELLKDARRSDRELAKVLGVSQPTVSRTISRLRDQGIIKTHTVIADFRRLGIELVAFTFGVWSPEKLRSIPEDERVEKAKKFFAEHPNVIFASSGQGLGKGRVVVTVHKDYSDYIEFMGQAQAEWAGMVDLASFLISLDSDVSPFPFSLRNLGKYLEKPRAPK
jgi:DNA-binding Lrp family transcriptional regulator